MNYRGVIIHIAEVRGTTRIGWCFTHEGRVWGRSVVREHAHWSLYAGALLALLVLISAAILVAVGLVLS